MDNRTKFKCIVADPPWPYKTPGKIGGSQEYGTPLEGNVGSRCRYGVMSIAEIQSLQVPSAKDSHLYLWFTNTFAVEAHVVAKAWGFRPVTIITWVKIQSDGTPSMKMGYYYRGATEHCLFCIRGKLRLCGPAHSTVFMTRRLPHSEKPEYFYQMVEAQNFGPYLELFARRSRPGWSVWGNDVVSDLIIPGSK